MADSDEVCIIELTTRKGERHEIPLARRADPVDALDKFLMSSRISRTDISALFCRVRVSSAITTRACEAMTATLQALM